MAPSGRSLARESNGCAGLGGWKKQMTDCNDQYTDLNIIRPEREPTSNWSLIARESEEPF